MQKTLDIKIQCSEATLIRAIALQSGTLVTADEADKKFCSRPQSVVVNLDDLLDPQEAAKTVFLITGYMVSADNEIVEMCEKYGLPLLNPMNASAAEHLRALRP